MKTFTRGNLPTLRSSLEAALQQVCEEHGVDVKPGNFSFNDTQASIKLEFTAAGEHETADAERTLFLANCRRKGIKPEAYKQDFEAQGDLFTIVGINTKAKTYPVKAIMKSTGAPYKFPLDSIPTKFLF